MTMLRTVYLEKINPEKNEDKFYQVDLEQEGETFKVIGTWGARSGRKPSSKVWYEGHEQHEAIKKYDSLVQSKTKEGYE